MVKLYHYHYTFGSFPSSASGSKCLQTSWILLIIHANFNDVGLDGLDFFSDLQFAQSFFLVP